MTEPRDPHAVALGQALIRLREEAKVTQEELADRAQISAEEIGQIEAGAVDADWGTLRRLAYGMEVKLADLFRLAEGLDED